MTLPSAVAPAEGPSARRRRPALRPCADPAWVRLALIGAVLLLLGVLVLAPVLAVFAEGLRKGWQVYWAALRDPAALAAVRLTLLAAAVAVPLAALFGLAAAWSLTRFRWRGKSLVLALVDLPLGVSPVVSGMMVVLLFGRRGIAGPWLASHGWQVVFAVPGIVLATLFVTFPFVARELVAFMEARGADEEEAAHVLGAGGWQTFVRVTLPNVKWSLLHGVVLCNARAMGEFGAVSVVSGHVPEATETLPLHVESLHDQYHFPASFAVASLLVLLAAATLAAKRLVRWRSEPARRRGGGRPT